MTLKIVSFRDCVMFEEDPTEIVFWFLFLLFQHQRNQCKFSHDLYFSLLQTPLGVIMTQ